MIAILRQMPPWLFVFFAFLLGAIFGSFVNAAIYRLPRNISMLTQSRSFCPQCNAMIHWYDNLPIASFLFLGGKCRSCKTPIPMRYLQVELLVSALFALAAWQFFVLNRSFVPGTLSSVPFALTAIQMFLAANLACAAFSDLETWMIPSECTVLLVPLGLLLAPLVPELHLSRSTFLTEPPGPLLGWNHPARWNALIDSVHGLIFGAGILYSVGVLSILVFKKEGMGGGDAWLVGGLGAILGFKPALAVFMIGLVIGLVLGIGSIVWDRIQQKRLGDRFEPRRPAYELSEEELAEGPGPAWPAALVGLLILGFEAVVLNAADQNASNALFRNLIAIFGAMIGLMYLTGALLKWHLVKQKRYPMGEIRTREDGTKEEVLHGNYIPFGPSLALAGLIVAFYDPLLRALAFWWVIGRYEHLGRYEWDDSPLSFSQWLAKREQGGAPALPFNVPVEAWEFLLALALLLIVLAVLPRRSPAALEGKKA